MEYVSNMSDIEKSIVEYEIELAINKQLYDENVITQEVYEKVQSLIYKNINNANEKLTKSRGVA